MSGAEDIAHGERAIVQFLYREARLLDAGRFEEWLGLFAEDGLYWVPSRPDQSDPLGVASIIYEDRGLLAMRIERLAHPNAHVMAPPPRTTHLLSNIEIESGPEEPVQRVAAAFLMAAYRGAQQRVYSGRCTYHLRAGEGGFRILLKRVDLADCDAVHGVMTIPF